MVRINKALVLTKLADCDADLLLVRQQYHAALAVQLALQTWDDPSFELRNSSARILRISARTRIPSYRNTHWRTASARTRTFRMESLVRSAEKVVPLNFNVRETVIWKLAAVGPNKVDLTSS